MCFPSFIVFVSDVRDADLESTDLFLKVFLTYPNVAGSAVAGNRAQIPFEAGHAAGALY